MRIVWTRPAAEDVDAIWEYLKERSANAAEQVQDTILKARVPGASQGVERLAEFPYSGRPGHFAGTRELVIARSPYIVVYGVVEGLGQAETEIVIYHVYHGAQN